MNPGAQGNCYPELFYDEATGLVKTQDLTLFRLDDRCEHVMKLLDAAGEVKATVDVDQFIAENKLEAEMAKSEATLRIGIEFTQLGVTIKIPDWEIVDVKPEF